MWRKYSSQNVIANDIKADIPVVSCPTRLIIVSASYQQSDGVQQCTNIRVTSISMLLLQPAKEPQSSQSAGPSQYVLYIL